MQLSAAESADAATGRLFWLKSTVIAAFCIGLSMSSALWIGPRSFPSTPFSSIPAIDGVVALGLYVALFVSAAVALAVREPRWPIVAFLAVVAVFCAADQTRLQPWVFQYSVLLAVIALHARNGADGERRTLNVIRLVIAFTYVYSGLQKINLNFFENEFPWIVQPITSQFPSADRKSVV